MDFKRNEITGDFDLTGTEQEFTQLTYVLTDAWGADDEVVMELVELVEGSASATIAFTLEKDAVAEAADAMAESSFEEIERVGTAINAEIETVHRALMEKLERES